MSEYVTTRDVIAWLDDHGLADEMVSEVTLTARSVRHDHSEIAHMRVTALAKNAEGQYFVDEHGDGAMNVTYVPIKRLPGT